MQEMILVNKNDKSDSNFKLATNIKSDTGVMELMTHSKLKERMFKMASEIADKFDKSFEDDVRLVKYTKSLEDNDDNKFIKKNETATAVARQIRRDAEFTAVMFNISHVLNNIDDKFSEQLSYWERVLEPKLSELIKSVSDIELSGSYGGGGDGIDIDLDGPDSDGDRNSKNTSKSSGKKGIFRKGLDFVKGNGGKLLAAGTGTMASMGMGVGSTIAATATGGLAAGGTAAAAALASNPVGWAIAGGLAVGALGYGAYNLSIDDDSMEVTDKLEDMGAMEHSLLGHSQITNWDVVRRMSVKELDALLRFDDWDDATKKAIEDLIESKKSKDSDTESTTPVNEITVTPTEGVLPNTDSIKKIEKDEKVLSTKEILPPDIKKRHKVEKLAYLNQLKTNSEYFGINEKSQKKIDEIIEKVTQDDVIDYEEDQKTPEVESEKSGWFTGLFNAFGSFKEAISTDDEGNASFLQKAYNYTPAGMIHNNYVKSTLPTADESPEMSKSMISTITKDNAPVTKSDYKPTKVMVNGSVAQSVDELNIKDVFNLNGINEDAINNLNDSVLHNLKAMGAEYYDIYGKKLNINSAYRSFKEQAKLKKEKGNLAAAPGSSMHNYGLAVDMNTADANNAIKAGLFDKYGFHRPVAREGWHVEPKGIDRAGIRKAGMSKYSEMSVATTEPKSDTEGSVSTVVESKETPTIPPSLNNDKDEIIASDDNSTSNPVPTTTPVKTTELKPVTKSNNFSAKTTINGTTYTFDNEDDYNKYKDLSSTWKSNGGNLDQNYDNMMSYLNNLGNNGTKSNELGNVVATNNNLADPTIKSNPIKSDQPKSNQVETSSPTNVVAPSSSSTQVTNQTVIPFGRGIKDRYKL